jgi:hypothetical protein
MRIRAGITSGAGWVRLEMPLVSGGMSWDPGDPVTLSVQDKGYLEALE